MISASPVRRGKTGIIYFRKAVPKDLWSTLGRREIKVSLRTRNAKEGRRLHADLNDKWEAAFAELRSGNPIELPIGISADDPPAPSSPAGAPEPREARRKGKTAFAGKAASPLETFDAMAREREFAPATIKRHRPIIEAVAKEHPDLRTITADWCVQWKDGLIESGLSARTVQYAYLASLRNLLGFAVTNRYLPSNPLLGLGVKVKSAKRNRPVLGG